MIDGRHSCPRPSDVESVAEHRIQAERAGLDFAIVASGASQSAFSHEQSLVYAGAEFCDALLPTADELVAVVECLHASGSELVFVTPPCDDAGLDLVLECCHLLPTGSEIVVNDWGVLRELGGRGFRLTAGRSFSKNKRDPRIETLWGRLPRDVQSEYRTPTTLSAGSLGVLRDHGVSRVEVDIPSWGLAIDPQGLDGVNVSVHYPYCYVTSARRCPTHLMAGLGVRSGGPCQKPCTEFCAHLGNQSTKQPLILSGNAYYYRYCLDDVYQLPADRLVFSPSERALGGVVEWR